MNAAENYVCDEHRTREEREKELFEKEKEGYIYYKRLIKRLEEKYPSLKDLEIVWQQKKKQKPMMRL